MKSLSFFYDQMRELAEQGGWVFWALLVLAFGIAFALISIVHFLRLPSAPRLSGAEWLQMLRGVENDEDAVARLVPMAGELVLIEQQLFDQLERRIRFAFVLIGAAPLVGLLGTVGGMLATFRGLASSVADAPSDVISGGVSEALITTQTGLVIAVPTFIVATVLKGHFQRLRFEFQRLQAAVARAVSGASQGI
jgi:biopolymer transport protein ExbB